MKQETLIISGEEYTLKIYLERRRNSLCSIGKSINIRLPTFLSSKDQEKEIERLKLWAISKIQENPPIHKITKEYNTGDTLVIREKKYTLEINTKEKKAIKSVKAKIIEDKIIIDISSSLSSRERKSYISSVIQKVIAISEQSFLEKKVRELNSIYFQDSLDKEVGLIKFKFQNTRWGSCSHKRNINISTRLLLAPESVLDYVCIHELAHLREPNHSAKFWSIIRSIDPDYKSKHKWLRQHGKDLII